MKAPKFANVDFTGVAYLAALGLGAFVVYKIYKALPDTGSVSAAAKDVAKQISNAVGAAVDAVNPANSDNLFNTGFNKAVKVITGKDSLYDVFNKAPADRDLTALRQGRDVISDDDAELGAMMQAARIDAKWPNAATIDGEQWGEQSPFQVQAP